MKKLFGIVALAGAYAAGSYFGNPLDQHTPTATTAKATSSGPQECTSEELRSVEYQRRLTEAKVEQAKKQIDANMILNDPFYKALQSPKNDR